MMNDSREAEQISGQARSNNPSFPSVQLSAMANMNGMLTNSRKESRWAER